MAYKRLMIFFLSVFLTPAYINAQVPSQAEKDQKYEEAKQDAMGICPPINLLDENGNIINPLENPNVSKPYSPKMTCGKCHDYDKITQGYHFQQGKGAKMTEDYAQAYPWAKSPGQYGGRW